MGEAIYGVDAETLENIICEYINQHNLSLCLVEFGITPSLAGRVRLGQPNHFHAYELERRPKSESDFLDALTTFRNKASCEIGFGIALIQNSTVQVSFAYQDTTHEKTLSRSYGGPREYAPLWAQNTGLDFLRRQLNQNSGINQEE